MYRFWYRRYFLDRFTRYFGNFFGVNLREQIRKFFRDFPLKASSKSTIDQWSATTGLRSRVSPCEVCCRMVRMRFQNKCFKFETFF